MGSLGDASVDFDPEDFSDPAGDVVPVYDFREYAAKPGCRSKVLAILTDTDLHFGDTGRVFSNLGAVVGEFSDTLEAEQVKKLYFADYGDHAEKLTLVSWNSLSVVQRVYVQRELDRCDRVAGHLDCEEFRTRDPVFRRIASCWRTLTQLSEELRSSRDGSGATNSETRTAEKPPTTAIERLLHAIERHRLAFLYSANAHRLDPEHDSYWHAEGVKKEKLVGWDDLTNDLDSDGEFLFKHRPVLERYAQECLDTFGLGSGVPAPGCNAENARFLPKWSLEEWAGGDLEKTSDAIVEACISLCKEDERPSLRELAKEVSSAARPDGHARWYTNVAIEWSYLATLDSLIAKIKAARLDAALEKAPSAHVSELAALSKSGNQNRADLVVLLVLKRDLASTQEDYPTAISAAVGVELSARVEMYLAFVLQRPEFHKVKALSLETKPQGVSDAMWYSALMFVALADDPSVPPPTHDLDAVPATIHHHLCRYQGEISPAVKALVDRFARLILVACKYPDGPNPDFVEHSRHFQLLSEYWEHAKSLIQLQTTVEAGFSIHPLLDLIENLRDRIRIGFDRLENLDGAGATAKECDRLILMLSEAPVHELSRDPGAVFAAIKRIGLFFTRARLQIGAREFGLTAAEMYFFSHCGAKIESYKETVESIRDTALTKPGDLVELSDEDLKTEETTAAQSRSATPIPVAVADNSEQPNTEKWLRLNAMERDILIALLEKKMISADHAGLPSQAIVAKWAGYRPDTSFKTALSGLVKAEYLGNGRHRGGRGGYFLTPEGVQAAEFHQSS